MIKEWAILDALTTRLTAITVANDYWTDAGNSVTTGYTHYTGSGDLPLISILPNENGDSVESHSDRSGKYKLSNEFIIEGHISVPTDLHPVYKLGRDMIRAVLADDLRIDNQAIDIKYSNQAITVAGDGNKIATVRITVAVIYHEDFTTKGA